MVRYSVEEVPASASRTTLIDSRVRSNVLRNELSTFSTQLRLVLETTATHIQEIHGSASQAATESEVDLLQP